MLFADVGRRSYYEEGNLKHGSGTLSALMVLSLFVDTNYAMKKPKISITYWNSRNYEAALTYRSEDDEWDFIAKAFTVS